MRRRRLRRWLTVGVLLLVGALVAGDVVALQFFQVRGGVQLARGLAAEGANVDLGGFPFLHDYVRGQRGDVEVQVTGPTGGGLRVADLSLELAETRFAPRAMFQLTRSRYATRTRVEATNVLIRLEIVESDLEAFMRARRPQVDEVRLTSSAIEVTFDYDDEELDDEDDDDRPVARFLPRVERVEDLEESGTGDPDGTEGAGERRLILRLMGGGQLPPREREDARGLQELLDLPPFPEDLRADITPHDGFFVVEGQIREIELWLGAGSS